MQRFGRLRSARILWFTLAAAVFSAPVTQIATAGGKVAAERCEFRKVEVRGIEHEKRNTSDLRWKLGVGRLPASSLSEQKIEDLARRAQIAQVAVKPGVATPLAPAEPTKSLPHGTSKSLLPDVLHGQQAPQHSASA